LRGQEGGGGNVFFLLHLTCGRRRGRGLFYFLNVFFIVEWLRRGGQGFFSSDLLKGDGRGRGLSFLNIHYGWGGVGFTYSILAKLN
jgi:hypothetical protein